MRFLGFSPLNTPGTHQVLLLLPLPPLQATRSFSAAAVEEHQPKVALFGLEAKYANALYTSASKAGALPKVEKEIKEISSLCATVAGFEAFLGNPTIARSDKSKDIATIMKKGKYSPTVSGFMGVLADNGRLGSTGKVGSIAR